MEAIVLAGGQGTRLRSVVPDLPKPMARIGQQPFLALLLTRLARQGVTDVVLSVGYMADAITSYFGKSFEGLRIQYYEEKTPLGTGGAVRASLGLVTSDHVFVVNGDTFLNVDIQQLESQWVAERLPIIVGRPVEGGGRYGRMEIADGRVVRFGHQSTGPGLINAGFYVLDRTTFDGATLTDPFSLEAFLEQSIRDRQFAVHISDGYFIDIGVPEDYRRAQTELEQVVN